MMPRLTSCTWARPTRLTTAGLLAGGLLAAGLAAAPAAFAATQITGAGSTFDYPFFSKAFYEYSQKHADVTVNYQSIGSGGGIQQFTAGTVDFGASDVPMDAQELARAKAPVLQIPVTLGGEGIAYNLPGIAEGAAPDPPARRRHLSRQNHQMGRSGDRQAQSRDQAPRHRDHRRAPLRRLGNHLYFHRFPQQRLARVETEGRRREERPVAGAEQHRRQGQRGCRRAGAADPGRYRLCRAGLSARKQHALRLARKQGRQIFVPDDRDRGGSGGNQAERLVHRFLDRRCVLRRMLSDQRLFLGSALPEAGRCKTRGTRKASHVVAGHRRPADRQDRRLRAASRQCSAAGPSYSGAKCRNSDAFALPRSSSAAIGAAERERPNG